MSGTNLCPCGSEKETDLCCYPVIRGTREATTAEELLRARYSAFTLGEIDFIVSSHHSRTREEVKREEIEDWSKNSKWLGLKILQSEGGKAEDHQGALIFAAHYEADGKTQEHLEKSFFEKEGTSWRFVDAQGVHLGTYRRPEAKVGRNDLCPCESGKKYKECCGS